MKRKNGLERANEIRKAYFSRQAKQKELAKIYMLSQANISKIISGHIWNE